MKQLSISINLLGVADEAVTDYVTTVLQEFIAMASEHNCVEFDVVDKQVGCEALISRIIKGEENVKVHH